MAPAAEGVRYRINANDEMVFVDDAWDRTAAGMSGPKAPTVVGKRLWEFIGDGPTRRIYREILNRVRDGCVAQFSLRCDDASHRRLMRMTVRLATSGIVEFHTEPLETVSRAPIPLLSHGVPRSDTMLRACSWCNRIDVGADEWTEVEDAVERLRLFERETVPQLSHGVCESCHAMLTDTIVALERCD